MTVNDIRTKVYGGKPARVDGNQLAALISEHLLEIKRAGEAVAYFDGLRPDVFVDAKTGEDRDVTLGEALEAASHWRESR